MVKVYCGNCVFIAEVFLRPKTSEYYCEYSDNVIDGVGNWYQDNTDTVHICHPRDINKNNDCIWYQEKDQDK